jgi:hypothetical protein
MAVYSLKHVELMGVLKASIFVGLILGILSAAFSTFVSLQMISAEGIDRGQLIYFCVVQAVTTLITVVIVSLIACIVYNFCAAKLKSAIKLDLSQDDIN